MSAYTSEQLTAGIKNAMAAGDMEAVVDLLYALASVDPHQAQLILDTIDIAAVLTA